jgi:hypothetical protein
MFGISYEAQKSGRAKNYKLWQDGFHPIILDTLEKIEQRVKYIHYNHVWYKIDFGLFFCPFFWF